MPIISPCTRLRRELGHQRQADGGEAQLAEGDDEVGQGEDLQRGDALRVRRRRWSRRTCRTPAPSNRKPRPNFTTELGSSLALRAARARASPSGALKMITKSEFAELFTHVGVDREPEEVRLEVVQREEAQRAAALLEEGPEQDGEEDEDQRRSEPLRSAGR